MVAPVHVATPAATATGPAASHQASPQRRGRRRSRPSAAATRSLHPLGPAPRPNQHGAALGCPNSAVGGSKPARTAGMHANWVLDRRRTCPQFHVARPLRQLASTRPPGSTLDDTPQTPAVVPQTTPPAHQRSGRTRNRRASQRAPRAPVGNDACCLRPSSPQTVKAKPLRRHQTRAKTSRSWIKLLLHVEIHPPR